MAQLVALVTLVALSVQAPPAVKPSQHGTVTQPVAATTITVDMPRLATTIQATLRDHPTRQAFLLRRHGLYTWGAPVPEAVRHVEILEFFLETVGRKEAASWRS